MLFVPAFPANKVSLVATTSLAAENLFDSLFFFSVLSNNEFRVGMSARRELLVVVGEVKA